MNSDKLISELSGELKGFTFVRPTLKVAVRWCLLAIALTVAASLLVSSFRPGVLTQLQQSPRFLAEITFGAILVFLSAWTALAFSIPGQKTKTLTSYTVFALFILAGLQAYSFFEPATEVSMVGKRPFCYYEGILYASLLVFSLLLIIRKRAPFGRTGISLLSGLAAVGITSTIMNAACMYEPYHMLTHHFAPLLPVTALALFLSAVLVRKI